MPPPDGPLTTPEMACPDCQVERTDEHRACPNCGSFRHPVLEIGGFAPCVKEYDQEAAHRIVLDAIQFYYGRWHDDHGFQWTNPKAEELSGELSEALGLDPARLACVQEATDAI